MTRSCAIICSRGVLMKASLTILTRLDSTMPCTKPAYSRCKAGALRIRAALLLSIMKLRTSALAEPSSRASGSTVTLVCSDSVAAPGRGWYS